MASSNFKESRHARAVYQRDDVPPGLQGRSLEGAAVELKMRLLAGKIPALQKHAHKIVLEDIEAGLIEHFGAALSDEDKGTLRLCRQLRNKVLHSDFHAARDKLSELGGTARRPAAS